MSKHLKYLVIHCTATRENVPISPEDIIRWHTDPVPKGRGWKQVGYSKLLLLDGTVHSFVNENDDDFVDPWEITNGVAGINSEARHICYVGGLDHKLQPKDTRNDLQKFAMLRIVADTIEKHPDILVAGHNQFSNKACPCFNVPEWLESIGVERKNYELRITN